MLASPRALVSRARGQCQGGFITRAMLHVSVVHVAVQSPVPEECTYVMSSLSPLPTTPGVILISSFIFIHSLYR